MTVREHFLVTERARSGTGRLWKDLLNRSKPTAEEQALADRMLDIVGLQAEADKPVESLSLGRGRLVELGRALMTQPKLLLLDEPSSGLDVKETAGLADKLAAVQAEHEFASSSSNTTWRWSRTSSPASTCSTSASSSPADRPPRSSATRRSARPTSGTWCERLQRPRRAGAPAGAADPGAMRRRGQLRAVPVPVRHLVLDRPGRRDRTARQQRSGKTTVVRICSGLLHPTAGQLRYQGEDVTNRRAFRLARLGVVHAPEGRSVFATLTVEEN